MATTAVSKQRRSGKRLLVQKPRGVLSPRVQRVGPEHFGIVAVDCAKARSKWMLCDFYGTILVPPTPVPHSRGHFDLSVLQVREAMAHHQLKDLAVAVERTGNYHLPVKRAFAAAGFECRIVHPLATKHFRQPAHPGVKTDDIDLAAIFLATVNGFGLIEEPLDPIYARLRLLVRHRRDLVEKRSAVCCQLREHWEATLPGFAALFEDLWGTPAALAIARRFDAPEAIVQAGQAGLERVLDETQGCFQSRSLERVLAWARTAPSPDPQAAMHHRIATALDDDRLALLPHRLSDGGRTPSVSPSLSLRTGLHPRQAPDLPSSARHTRTGDPCRSPRRHRTTSAPGISRGGLPLERTPPTQSSVSPAPPAADRRGPAPRAGQTGGRRGTIQRHRG